MASNSKDELFIDNCLQAYIIALNEGKEKDSEYVRKLAYSFYELDKEKL